MPTNTEKQPHRTGIFAAKPKFATVLVGKDQERYVVHEHLLVHYSKFFRAALTGSFKEAVEKVIKLEDTNPEVFEFFIHWLYYQRFPDNHATDDKDVVTRWSICVVESCIYLHIFGDKFDVEKLRLDTINEVVRLAPIRRWFEAPRGEVVEAAFCTLPKDSPMCQLIIDYHYRYNDAEALEYVEEFKCLPFLHGIWMKCKQVKSTHCLYKKLKDLEACDYHNHTSRQEWKRCANNKTSSLYDSESSSSSSNSDTDSDSD